MRCTPAPLGGSSLSIMPAKVYPHFDEFLMLAQLYWREGDFPKRVSDYFWSVVARNDPYKMTKVELEEMCKSAEFFAEVIYDTIQDCGGPGTETARHMVNTMLNWKFLYGNPPVIRSSSKEKSEP